MGTADTRRAGRPRATRAAVHQPRGSGGVPIFFRALFALRWKLGKLFGWDKPGSGVGERVRSLRERLPADLRERRVDRICARFRGGGQPGRPPVFSSVYQTHDEWAAETFQQDRARGDAHRLGAGQLRRWLPRANGRAGKAERTVRQTRTWPRSSRSGTRSCIRCCCDRSDADGRCRRRIPDAPRRRARYERGRTHDRTRGPTSRLPVRSGRTPAPPTSLFMTGSGGAGCLRVGIRPTVHACECRIVVAASIPRASAGSTSPQIRSGGAPTRARPFADSQRFLRGGLPGKQPPPLCTAPTGGRYVCKTSRRAPSRSTI